MSVRDDFKRAIADRVFISAQNATIVQRDEREPEAKWIFDFRAVMLEPQWLDAYAELFWEKYASRYPFQVGGQETAGIPLVAAIVMKGVQRGTPVNGFFIRKSRKRDGLMKFIEGTLTDDQIILVDDLINTGTTVNKQVKILADIEKKVDTIFAILAFRAQEAYAPLSEKGIHVDTLYRISDFGLKLLTDTTTSLAEQFEVLWRFAAGEPSFNYVVPKSAPIIDAERVYFGSDRGIFWALNKNDGAVAWKFEVGKHPKYKGIFSSPALHGGTVYFGAYDGNVYALDAVTGERQWTNSDADWIGSSPALAPDLGLVFVGLEFGLWRKRGGIAALDMKTGRCVWKDISPALTHGSPLYIKEEEMVVIGSNDGVLRAYDAKGGKMLWQFASDGPIQARPAYDAVNRQIVFSSTEAGLYIVTLTGIVRHTVRTVGGFYSNPLVQGAVVYAASLDKTLYAIDLESGKIRWNFQTTGRIFASPTIADGSVWIGSNDGRLYEIEPISGEFLRSFQFSERIVNAIAYDAEKKLLFVPTVANEIYCLRRKETQADSASA